jgi:hypothetical protein
LEGNKYYFSHKFDLKPRLIMNPRSTGLLFSSVHWQSNRIS